MKYNYIITSFLLVGLLVLSGGLVQAGLEGVGETYSTTDSDTSWLGEVRYNSNPGSIEIKNVTAANDVTADRLFIFNATGLSACTELLFNETVTGYSATPSSELTIPENGYFCVLFGKNEGAAYNRRYSGTVAFPYNYTFTDIVQYAQDGDTNAIVEGYNTNYIFNILNVGVEEFITTDPVPPSINQSSLNVSSAYQNSSVWAANTTEYVYTQDSTPTITFNMDKAGNCSIGLHDENHTAMISRNTDTLCGTTNTLEMTCTLPQSEELPWGNTSIYVGCMNLDGYENTTSTSTALAFKRIPYEPVLVSPANYTLQELNTNTSLRWNTSKYTGNHTNLTYWVLVNTTGEFTLIYNVTSNLTNATLNVSYNVNDTYTAWKVKSQYFQGDMNISSDNSWEFNTTDTTNPTCNILSPASGSSIAGGTINIAYSSTDTYQLNTTWYSSDSGTNTTTTSTPISLSMTFGTHTFELFCNDSYGNTGTDTITYSNYAVVGSFSTGGGGGGSSTESTDCEIELVKPKGTIYKIGDPGQKTDNIEIIFKNKESSTANFHYAITGDVDCTIQNTDIEMAGNSQFTNTLQCTIKDGKHEGRLIVQTSNCDTSIPIITDTSKLAGIIAWAGSGSILGLIGMFAFIIVVIVGVAIKAAKG